MNEDTPVSARRAQTRQKLLDAALQAFATLGVQGTSVEALCELAGFTRGAFYSNFSSKDELCEALLHAQREHNYDAAQHALTVTKTLTSPQTVDDLISAAIDLFLSAQRTDPTWVLASQELRLHAARTPEMRESYRRFAAESRSMFLALVEPAIAQAGYRFAVAPEQALDMLRGVWELSLVIGLIEENADPKDISLSLANMLGTVLVPITETH